MASVGVRKRVLAKERDERVGRLLLQVGSKIKGPTRKIRNLKQELHLLDFVEAVVDILVR